VKKLVPIPILLLLAGGFVIMTSCKQQDGERCQLPSDCESGKCNQAEHRCVSDNSNAPLDANYPEFVIDAPAVDMMVDAIDAPPGG
jgi:hypothetical protein